MNDEFDCISSLFSRLVLNRSVSFEEFGSPTMYMSLALLVAWLLVCVCIIRGVQSSAKVDRFSLSQYEMSMFD